MNRTEDLPPLKNDFSTHFAYLQDTLFTPELWRGKKLYYCMANASASENGVNKKIVSQIAALNQIGVDCTALLTGENLSKTGIWDSVPCIKIEVAKPLKGWFRQSRFLSHCIQAMGSYLDSIPGDRYKLYMRYPGSNGALNTFCKKFSNRITMEFNSKDEDEIRFLAKEHKFNLRPSLFLSWLENSQLTIFNEKFWGTHVRRKLPRMVAPTKEILDYQRHRGGPHKVRGLVLGNGIAIGNSVISPKILQPNTINLLFLDGGSQGNDWNGLEFLEPALGTSPNDNYTINLDIYGHCPLWALDHPFINAHKPVPVSEIHGIAKKYDIGVSSFSLGRIGLKEASKLKAREYVGCGLPLLYGYLDADIEPLVKLGLSLRVMPDTTVSRPNLIHFAKTFYSDPENPVKLRMYAHLALDYSVKMKRLAIFLNPCDIAW